MADAANKPVKENNQGQDPEILEVCKQFDATLLDETRYTDKLPEVSDKIVYLKRVLDGSGIVKEGFVEEAFIHQDVPKFHVGQDKVTGRTIVVKPEDLVEVNGVKFSKKMSAVLDKDMLPEVIHGRVIFDRKIKDWSEPDCVVICPKGSRPGYHEIPSHEYEDDPATLVEKVKVLADLLKKSKSCCVYSGAGLSTASGIDDYASKAGGKSKINVGRKKVNSRKEAMPNIGHRTFAALANEGLVQNWIQQNHDGLPQKAGFPQHRINEIHGAWFDPSNVVVPMSGDLRDDLWDWMVNIKHDSDLVIAVGTSLSGMSADQVFEKACVRNKKWGSKSEKGSFGGVIIGLQQTQHDEKAYLRIYSRIDVVVSLLAREMKLIVPPLSLPLKLDLPPNTVVEEDVFRVPYDSEGCLTKDPEKMVLWNLKPFSKVKVTDGSGKGFHGIVINKVEWAYIIRLPCQRQNSKELGKTLKNYSLGKWWIETCAKGLWPKLPVVNMGRSLKLQLER